MKVHTNFDDLNVLLDVERADRATDVVYEGHATRAEAVKIVFQPDRPNVGKRPFKAGARCPAKPGLHSFKVISRKHIGRAVAIARPGGATFGIEQPIVPRVAHTRGYAGQ